MGIRNLKVLLNKYANGAITEKFLCTYENKIIAIDTSIYLYRFIYKNGDPIELFIKQIMRFLKNKVTPLYIFDGKPPQEKNNVLDERSSRKKELISRKTKIKQILNKTEKNIEENVEENIEENVGEAEEDKEMKELKEMNMEELKEELEKVEKRIIVVNAQVIGECKKLFKMMGVPYIVANGEAEKLCTRLAKKDIVYGCLSEDTDILANGSKIFLRNFNVNNNKVIEYNLEKVLELMNISYEQFIDICILCGCDYTCTIKNIGIEKAYKFIKQYGNIEEVIKNIKDMKDKNNNNKYIVPENFNYNEARKLFLDDGEEEAEEKNIILGDPQVENIIKTYDDKIKTNTKMDIKRNLKKYNKIIMNENQSKLDKYFIAN